jgi:hypothetical protein
MCILLLFFDDRTQREQYGQEEVAATRGADAGASY